MKSHQEMDPTEGVPVGRDPRKMRVAELEAMGKARISRGDAIRAKCLDCCCGSPAEVRRCGMVDCALWPFRMGTDPYRAPATAESVERGRALAARHAPRAQNSRQSPRTSATDALAGRSVAAGASKPLEAA